MIWTCNEQCLNWNRKINLFRMNFKLIYDFMKIIKSSSLLHIMLSLWSIDLLQKYKIIKFVS
jgi:hypothetical protein